MANNKHIQPIGKWLLACLEQEKITETEFGKHVGPTGVDISIISDAMRLKRRGDKLLKDMFYAAWEFGWIKSLGEVCEILMDNPRDLIPTEKITRILKLLEEEVTKRNMHIPQSAPLKQYNLVVDSKDKEALELFEQLGVTIIRIKKALSNGNIQDAWRIFREEFALYSLDKVTQAVERLIKMIKRITDL